MNDDEPDEIDLAAKVAAEMADKLLARRVERERREQAADELSADSWCRVDLTDALAGQVRIRPTLLQRTDGLGLLYPGRTHWLQGEPESLKSWLAQYAASQVLELGGSVIYLDFEDNEYAMVERLIGLGTTEQAIRHGLAYVRPMSALGDESRRVSGGLRAFVETLHARDYTLAVVDGVTDSLATEGLDLNDNVEVAEWLRRIPRRIRVHTRASVVVIDHVTKSRDDRGRYAIGAQHKLAGLDGVAYTISTVRPLYRAVGEIVTGVARIEVNKDRPGVVRAQAVAPVEAGPQLAGQLVIVARPDGTLDARIDPTPTYTDDVRPVALVDLLVMLNTLGASSESRIERYLVDRHDVQAIYGAVMFAVEANLVDYDESGRFAVVSINANGRKLLDE